MRLGGERERERVWREEMDDGCDIDNSQDLYQVPVVVLRNASGGTKMAQQRTLISLRF